MMDIQKEKEAFQKFCEENFDFERHEQTYFDEQTQCYENDIGEDTESINMAWMAWQAAKAQAVPDLGELQERIAGHQYYHDEHGHMIVDMDDVVKEISGFDSWKSQAVPEGFVLVPKDKISHFYQDNDEPENFCNSSNDWDCLGDGIDKDQIMIVNKHTQANISTEKFYGAWKLIETSYGTRWKFELFKSESEAKQAMLEAQEPAND